MFPCLKLSHTKQKSFQTRLPNGSLAFSSASSWDATSLHSRLFLMTSQPDVLVYTPENYNDNEQITIINRGYIFNWLFFYCHVKLWGVPYKKRFQLFSTRKVYICRFLKRESWWNGILWFPYTAFRARLCSINQSFKVDNFPNWWAIKANKGDTFDAWDSQISKENMRKKNSKPHSAGNLLLPDQQEEWWKRPQQQHLFQKLPLDLNRVQSCTTGQPTPNRWSFFAASKEFCRFSISCGGQAGSYMLWVLVNCPE